MAEDIKKKLLEIEDEIKIEKKQEKIDLPVDEKLRRLPREKLKEIELQLPKHVLNFLWRTKMELLSDIAKYPKNRTGYVSWLADGYAGDYTDFLQLHVYYVRFLVPLLKKI
ncbi:MAG TPA: hypothetical protein ENL41_00455 [candidate division WOR-3 bacterium]|uniref:Uncharacterized protein n=1 Tax=candidate division WOR-3 bacterium TaxID=2052148 RepID=A0A7C5I1B5_UNCW3|nr:hypothetical protein [candidate division WOR-3 bacterium]